MGNIKDMDIYITPPSGGKIHIPVNPEKLQIGSDAKFISFSPISGGEVKVPHGSAPEEISWSGIFVGYERKTHVFVKEYTDPNTLVSRMNQIRDNGMKCNVMVTGTKINGYYYLQSFKGKYSGGYGDFYYDLKFIAAKEIVISSVAKKTDQKKKTQTVKRAEPAKKQTTTPTKAKTVKYTIRKGDTLWGIATKKLKKGSRYTEILKLNRSKLDSVAKKHGKKNSNNGRWIYAGTTITIPSK